MPINENFISPGSITPTYPGTNNPVTHSFDDRQLTAEFDDALVDQKAWKNSRYDGSKLTAAKLNQFTSGDSSYQNEPVLTNQTTALYIANTVIGGTEDPQFATIKNHSYVGISKIVLVNSEDNSVQVIDKTTEPFTEFHRFITNDFPTGNKAFIKIIDESIQTNLKGHHRVKMNKGFLLKSFDFNFAGEFSGSSQTDALTENNSIYLYKSGSFEDDFLVTGSLNSSATAVAQTNTLRFRYGVIEMFHGNEAGTTGHRTLEQDRIGPLFISSSIIENQFTSQYYSGSFGLIKHQNGDSDDDAVLLGGSSLGSASRFLGLDTLNFLTNNIADSTLTQQEKTEVHITFFEGTKDFAPGTHDERSIGTFEVDQNIGNLQIEAGDQCNDGLPTNHELVFKGRDDSRFLPTLDVFTDTISNSHIQSTASNGEGGCNPTYFFSAVAGLGDIIYPGTSTDQINIDCYMQGGALGVVGFNGAQSASADTYGQSLSGSMTADNIYSGSFSYEMSFLDKDHTLILDLDKDAELFDGIGDQGLVLIPQDADSQVAFNVEYYLAQAGIIDNNNINLSNVINSSPLGLNE